MSNSWNRRTVIMNTKILVSPQRYVQGPDTLSQIGAQLGIFGITNPLIMASPSALRVCREAITKSLEDNNIKHAFIEFHRECTVEEIYRVRDACLDGKHDAIISCGGGKAMDTGRAAAAGVAINPLTSPPKIFNPLGANVSCIQVPTVAASNAATASASVIYNEHGTLEAFVLMRINPAMIVVDTKIIAQAPVRTLVAGIGDALATYFEAEASHNTGTPALTGGLPTRTTLMMTRLAFDVLMESGVAAKQEVKIGAPGTALEAVVEANILLSGLGYECGGLAAAHAIAGSFSKIHDKFNPTPYHGELVAFSTLTQLVMEQRDDDFLDRIFGFCKDVGLPTTFKEMGLEGVSDKILKEVADDASKSILIRSMPKAYKTPDKDNRFYDPEEIFKCLKNIDARRRV
jgi:glycerol dehydrogenase